jgi:hypothetical protein
MEAKMEDRLFQLNECVTVFDRGGAMGVGKIVGRSYTEPMRYDVRFDRDVPPEYLAGEVMKDVAGETLGKRWQADE